MANSGFPPRWRRNPPGGVNTRFRQIFPKNCMKLKEFCPPCSLRSANVLVDTIIIPKNILLHVFIRIFQMTFFYYVKINSKSTMAIFVEQHHTFPLPPRTGSHLLPQHTGTTVYAQASGTNPTGMHSCLRIQLLSIFGMFS